MEMTTFRPWKMLSSPAPPPSCTSSLPHTQTHTRSLFPLNSQALETPTTTTITSSTTATTDASHYFPSILAQCQRAVITESPTYTADALLSTKHSLCQRHSHFFSLFLLPHSCLSQSKAQLISLTGKTWLIFTENYYCTQWNNLKRWRVMRDCISWSSCSFSVHVTILHPVSTVSTDENEQTEH